MTDVSSETLRDSLEPDAVEVARPVLRGPGRSNAPRLPAAVAPVTATRGHPALAAVLASFEHHYPDHPVDKICGAFELADAAHAGQKRRSGEPYITHPLAVALLVAELGMDEASICAALCHDTVEDCGVELNELAGVIGEEAAFLVDGVTKIDRIRSVSASAAKAGTLRKLLVALAKDVRVLVVKLCDRLHNMRTITALPPEKAQKIAAETLEVYAPLAHRLGMGELKWQLEDLSFSVLHPERYEEISRLVSERTPDTLRYVNGAISQLRTALEDAGISAQISGRAKHLWSVYEKMVVRGKEFDAIHDLIGLRIIVPDVKDCYAALGVIHSLWIPIPGRFKDYIATPKFNLYQSLHLTVHGPEHRTLEVQIRTEEMHRRAESGVAAHWSYKSDKTVRPVPGRPTPQEPAWVRRLLDLHEEADDPDVFLAGLQEDLSSGEVVVFTPRGEVVALPAGATPLDFAYSVHSEVGATTSGAKVNGRLVPLSTKLSTGDTVEIITSRSAHPSYGWLNLVVTPRARAKIRNYLSRERREDQLVAGREELERALRAEKLPSNRLTSAAALSAAASELRYSDAESMLVAVAERHLPVRNLVARLRSQLEASQEVPVAVPSPRTLRPSRPPQPRPSSAGIHLEGLDDVLVHLAQCCNPLPGNEILGYVTRGRGVSIHRTDCLNAASLSRSSERCIDVEWTLAPEEQHPVTVELEALDRPGLLSDVTRTLTDSGVNILECSTATGEDQVAHQRFTFPLVDSAHLEQVIEQMSRVDGVYTVRRA